MGRFTGPISPLLLLLLASSLVLLALALPARVSGKNLDGCSTCSKCRMALLNGGPLEGTGTDMSSYLTTFAADNNPEGMNEVLAFDAGGIGGPNTNAPNPPFMQMSSFPRASAPVWAGRLGGLSRCGMSRVWITTVQTWHTMLNLSASEGIEQVDLRRAVLFGTTRGSGLPQDGDLDQWNAVSLPGGTLASDEVQQNQRFVRGTACQNGGGGDDDVTLYVLSSSTTDPQPAWFVNTFRATRDEIEQDHSKGFGGGENGVVEPKAYVHLNGGDGTNSNSNLGDGPSPNCLAARKLAGGDSYHLLAGFLKDIGVFTLKNSKEGWKFEVHGDPRWAEHECEAMWFENSDDSPEEDLFFVARQEDAKVQKFQASVDGGGGVKYIAGSQPFSVPTGRVLAGVATACDAGLVDWALVIGLIAGGVCCCILAIGGIVVFRRRQKKKKQKQNNSSASSEELGLAGSSNNKKKNRKNNRGSSSRTGSKRGSVASGSPNSSSDEQLKMVTDVEVGRIIGAGSFGDVHRGTWQGTTDVALKKLKGGPAELREFATEARTLQKLDHPRVVRFFGVYAQRDEGAPSSEEDDDDDSDDSDSLNEFGGISFSPHTTFYMVTEFMTAGGVNTLLQEERDAITLVQLVSMAVDTAAGMKYLASVGIVHRDLSARNLLAQREGSGVGFVVKVADFGLSRSDYYSSSSAGGSVFPVKWSPPEVIEYEKFSVSSDVFSFAVTLWELMSYGRVPWMGMSNTEAMERVLKGERLARPEIAPDGVWDLMSRCWDGEASRRPDFEECFRTLKAIYGGLGGASDSTADADADPSASFQFDAGDYQDAEMAGNYSKTPSHGTLALDDETGAEMALYAKTPDDGGGGRTPADHYAKTPAAETPEYS
jgi:Protein tyrosine and serine/threonine kinase